MSELGFRNRIISYGVKPASQFTANPANPRVHPQFQRDVMHQALTTLGWIAPVIENSVTGYLVDGHERIFQALEQGDETPVPYVSVELDEADESYAIATFDPITSLAAYDAAKLDALLKGLAVDGAAGKMLAELAINMGLTPPDFQPVGIGDQPRLDQKKPITCPHCGMEFVPDG